MSGKEIIQDLPDLVRMLFMEMMTNLLTGRSQTHNRCWNMCILVFFVAYK